jgi:hypothetical protein
MEQALKDSKDMTASGRNMNQIAGDLRKDLNPNLRYPSGTTAEDIMKNVNTGKLPSIEPTQDMITGKSFTARPFIQDAGGESALGRFIRNKTTAFNPRVIKSGDELARNAGNTVQNAETKILGNRTMIQHTVDKLNKVAKGMSQPERDAVMHVLENEFPKSYNGLGDFATRNGLNADRIQSLADNIRPLLDHIRDADLKAGTLTNTLDNYAPHMIKGSSKDIEELAKKYKDDADIQKMAKMSKENKSALERKSFSSFAQLDNKLYALQKQISKETDPEKVAQLQEKLHDISNLFERDPIKAYGQVANRSLVARAFKEMQDNLSRDGLMKVVGKKEGIDIPTHMTQLKPDEIKALGLNGEEHAYYMHDDLKNYLMKQEKLFTHEGMNKFLANANAVTNVWKSLVTTHLPVHFVNNFIGNTAVNTMAGIKPQDYAKAMRLMKKATAGTLNDAEKVLFQKAVDSGAMTGFMHEFMPNRGARGSKIEQFAEKVRNNPYARLISKKGDSADDMTRLAHFVGTYRQSGSFEKAAKSMREHLFNYNEMGKGDKVARLVNPFWNWTRRNLPLQLKGLLSQPRYASTYHKIISDAQGKDSKAPEFMKDFGLPLPGGHMVDLRLPVQDLNQFGKGNFSDISNNALGQLTPVAKVPIELATNHQFFTQKPIDPSLAKNGGNYDPSKVTPYLMNQTGILGKISKFAQDDSKSKNPTENWQKASAFFLPKIYTTK